MQGTVELTGYYVLMEDTLPLQAFQWVGEPLGHYVDELHCTFEGAIRSGEVFLPVVRANGYLYHHTPQVDRARNIMAGGFSLRERVNGRANGDGVYACRTPDAAEKRGGGAVVQIGLYEVLLLDSSKGDDYRRVSSLTTNGRSLERVLTSAGIHGLLCTWGAVIYEPALAVPVGYRPIGHL